MLSRNYRTELDIRKHQIDTLKIFNDNVTELTEGTDYKIVFTAGNNELTLNVYLSCDFPNACPEIRIKPLIVHPWVATDGQVTKAPGLLNYSIHSDLGRVVQAIIREFERHPPVLASDSVNETSSEMDTSKHVKRDSKLFHSPIRTLGMPMPTSMPMYFPDLNNLSTDELKKMKDCVDKQHEFIDNLEQVKEINATIDALIVQIENTAEESLSKQEILKRKKMEVLEKTERVTILRNKCETLNRKYQSLADKYTPSNIQNLLEVEAMNKDKECEAIASKFLNGGINVETFLQSYIKAKKASQLCRTKEEKLANQLIELKRKGF